VVTEPSRLQTAIGLVRVLTSFHRRTFVIAVIGAAVYATCTVASSFGVGYLVDEVILPRFSSEQVPIGSLIIGSLIIVGIGLLRAAGVVVRRSFAGITEWRTAQSLSMLVVRRVMSQSSLWHKRHMTGDIVARIGVDSDAAVGVLAPLPFSTSVVLLVVLSSIWLVIVDAPLGLLALFIIPVLLLLNIAYQRRIDRHYDSAQKELGQLSEAVHESFDGVLVVKAFGAEGRETHRLSIISRRLCDARKKAVGARATFEALLDGVPTLMNILLIAVGAVRVKSGDMSIGELTSFIYLFTLLIFPLRIIGYVLSEIPHSSSGWKRVNEILSEPLESDPRTIIKSPQKGFGLQVEHVSFGFSSNTEDVVKDVDFSLPVGSIAAVVGPTGCGKSSLLQLIAGLYAPSEGCVYADIANTSIVFQEPFLVSGSIKENIVLDRGVADEQLESALFVSAADEFINQFDQGINTLIGERGVMISGGQRQRIALARALACSPTLLLLDDTTSALDPNTEQLIIQRIRSDIKSTTILLVATRPSTIALADVVLFMEEGRLSGMGTHGTLMYSNDRYRELIKSFENDRMRPMHD
jgi:ATP-binding cassette subfamily B protein